MSQQAGEGLRRVRQLVYSIPEASRQGAQSLWQRSATWRQKIAASVASRYALPKELQDCRRSTWQCLDKEFIAAGDDKAAFPACYVNPSSRSSITVLVCKHSGPSCSSRTPLPKARPLPASDDQMLDAAAPATSSPAMRFLRFLFSWAPEEHLSETAWLNGVRGLAAFLVLMSHYTLDWMSKYAEAPFGALVLDNTALSSEWYFRKGQRLWAPWRMPILRMFMCNGGGQVALFFIVSGFAITWGPLHQSDLRSLGSSVARRWTRLYIPCGIVNLIYLFESQIRFRSSFGDFMSECWRYIQQFVLWSNPFKTILETSFTFMQGLNVVVWTIPLEFYGSIFVYTLVLAVGRYSHPVRMIVILLVTIWTLFSLKWVLWLFGTGLLLAEYTFKTKPFERTRPWVAVAWTFGLLVGLFFLSSPGTDEGYTNPVFGFEASMPLPPGWRQDPGQERFWWGLGATLIVASACHLKYVRKFYELSLLQHLGKISFMLYLTHLVVSHVVGDLVQRAAYAHFCNYVDDPDFGIPICQMNFYLHGAILVSLWLTTVPVVLILAGFLERLVDRPVTNLAKKIDTLLSGGRKKKPAQKPEQKPEAVHLLATSSIDSESSSSSSSSNHSGDASRSNSNSSENITVIEMTGQHKAWV